MKDNVKMAALRAEYNALSKQLHTPEVEKRLDELAKLLKTNGPRIRRHRLQYRGTYEEMLASHWREYVLDPSDPLYHKKIK